MGQSLVKDLRSVELSREARGALASCDHARLQELLVLSGELADGLMTATHLQSFGRTEFEALGALIRITRENMTIIRRSKAHEPARLEYQPFFTRSEDGAMY